MLIVVAGENRYGCHQQLDDLLAPYRKQQFAISQFDLEEMEDPQILCDQVTNASLFTSNDIYLIRGINDSAETIDVLVKAARNLPQESTMIVYAAGLPATGKLVKTLQSLGAQMNISQPLPVEQLLDWIIATVEATGGLIDRITARHLLDWVGEDQLALQAEIEKLVLFRPQITASSIEEITVPLPRTTIFNLLEAMVGGRQIQSARYCRSLLDQRIDPNYIMSMICWQAYMMSVTVASKKDNWQKVAVQTGVSAYALSRTAAVTKNISRQEMMRLNERILEGDRRLKNDNIDKERFIEQLVAKITLSRARPKGS